MPKPKKKFPALKNYSLPDKYGDGIGYRVVKMDKKLSSAKTSLDLRDDHLSPAGRIHGGVISGFFDHSCGAAVFTTLGPEDFCSTVELKVNYFAPLNSGDKLTCEARVVFRGNKLCTVLAFLYKKGRKDPVGMASATFNIVAKKK